MVDSSIMLTDRAKRLATVETCQRPPRAVRMPRLLRATASAPRVETPVVLIDSMTGRTLAAKRSASKICTSRPSVPEALGLHLGNGTGPAGHAGVPLLQSCQTVLCFDHRAIGGDDLFADRPLGEERVVDALDPARNAFKGGSARTGDSGDLDDPLQELAYGVLGAIEGASKTRGFRFPRAADLLRQGFEDELLRTGHVAGLDHLLDHLALGGVEGDADTAEGADALNRVFQRLAELGHRRSERLAEDRGIVWRSRRSQNGPFCRLQLRSSGEYRIDYGQAADIPEFPRNTPTFNKPSFIGKRTRPCAFLRSRTGFTLTSGGILGRHVGLSA